METSILGQELRLTAAILVTTLALFPIYTISSSEFTAPLPNDNYTQYIKTSCNSTTYPELCYNSLSSYATEIRNNPKLLVLAALNVTLKSTKSTSSLFRNMSKGHNLKPRDAAAMADCVEEVADSVYELRRSIGEMGHIGSANFSSVISDAQTWVSAALTDDDTCTDGFSDIGKVANPHLKITVRRHIEKIEHLTSNALALINLYASSS